MIFFFAVLVKFFPPGFHFLLFSLDYSIFKFKTFGSIFSMPCKFVNPNFSGLMSNTAQPTSNNSSSNHHLPPTTTTVASFFHNHHQFQPIQCQPLIGDGAISAAVAASTIRAGKVNVTATHIELEPQGNCNITTLLNMSCRGRAEAFARSLQSRLRTLGSQVSKKKIFNFFY